MAITGSLANHTHPESFPTRSGNFGDQNTVLKLPDGTMIQTYIVEFGPSIRQPPYYNIQNETYVNGKHIYNTYTPVTSPSDNGYDHDRRYYFNWPIQFVSKPTVLSSWEVNHYVKVDQSIAYDPKCSNSQCVFQLYDPGSEQHYVKITFTGIGRWK